LIKLLAAIAVDEFLIERSVDHYGCPEMDCDEPISKN
jgi:hypothetical protein